MSKLKLFLLLSIFFMIAASKVAAQELIRKIDFEESSKKNRGIVGSALDLGDVPHRLAIATENPLKDAGSFSAFVWVKPEPGSVAAYTVLSAMKDVKFRDRGWKRRIIDRTDEYPVSFAGWKIGVSDNGSWCVTVRDTSKLYRYRPTANQQPLHDGKWHLLGFTYDNDINEIRFFYDGAQMAIYHIPELKPWTQGDTLVIGNGADSEYDYRTKEKETFFGRIDDVSLYRGVLNAEQISAYYKKFFPGSKKAVTGRATDSLRVTAFNIWHAGKERGKEIGLARTIQLLKQQKPDVVTMVETYGAAEEIAGALGYQFYLVSTNLAIFSRYPIEKTERILRPFNCGGAQLELPNGRHLRVFAVWLNYIPVYRTVLAQRKLSVDEFLTEERKTRQTQIETILNELNSSLPSSDTIPIILGGDFNSGSHLDWTAATAKNHYGYILPWPVSKALAEAGFKDTYRIVYPDPLRHPGVTIPLVPEFKGEIMDRIDYIYYRSKLLRPLNASVINTNSPTFPSDHAGVTTTFLWRDSDK